MDRPDCTDMFLNDDTNPGPLKKNLRLKLSTVDLVLHLQCIDSGYITKRKMSKYDLTHVT